MKKITVCIPNYIRQVKMSEKRKPLFYRFYPDYGICKEGKGNPAKNKMPLHYVDSRYLLKAQAHDVVTPWMLKPIYKLAVYVNGKVDRIVPFEMYDHNSLNLEQRVAKSPKELA